jgi:LmbE family N-acetylglucosaminyl deacetylase
MGMLSAAGRAPSARLIQGEGTSEALWGPWLRACNVPVRPLSTWLRPLARLVVVAPHPDDEVLLCGGLLHVHAARGGACTVVVVSDGEASHAGEPGWDAAALGRTRRYESSRGLQLLAPRASVERLGLPDGALQTHASELDDALQRILAPQDVVATTWRHDGHPDHEAVGEAAVRACTAADCTLLEAPVWMWHWAHPDDAAVPWHHMACLALPPDTLARKHDALQEHRTQLQPRAGTAGPVLGDAILARVRRPVEYFITGAP